jgi:hypothetical protein
VEALGPASLVVDVVAASEQPLLDRWPRSARRLAALARRRFGYDPWPGYGGLLDAAQEHGATLVAAGHDPASADLDGLVAQAILSAPRPALALAGEISTAPGLLPAALGRAEPGLRLCVIHQAPDGAHLRLARQGRTADAIRFGRGRFGLTHTHPAASHAAFLSWAEHREPPLDPALLEPVFTGLVKDAAQYFSLPEPRSEPDVFGPGEIAALLNASDMDESDIRSLVEQAAQCRSRFLPGLGAVYLGTLAPSHVAEEAAHAVLSRGREPPPLDPDTRFFTLATHEALAFHFSLTLNPRRPMGRRPDSVPSPARVRAMSPADVERWAHALGYALGRRLTRYAARRLAATSRPRSAGPSWTREDFDGAWRRA